MLFLGETKREDQFPTDSPEPYSSHRLNEEKRKRI